MVTNQSGRERLLTESVVVPLNVPNRIREAIGPSAENQSGLAGQNPALYSLGSNLRAEPPQEVEYP